MDVSSPQTLAQGPDVRMRRASIVGRHVLAAPVRAGIAMTGRVGPERPRIRQTSLYASCVPGLGRMLRRQLDADGTTITGTGSDGRSQLVFLAADRAGRAALMRSRLAESVFAEIGRASRAGGAGPGAVAALACKPDGLQRALSVWAEEVAPLSASMTFRVIARVRSQSRFLRSELRRAMRAMIARDKPRWRLADPAELEIWISEWHDGQYVAGLRLSGAGRRQHGSRTAGRPGALPPTVAAAMVQLAGEPRGMLFDPCCGQGTILAEALAAGWAADGTDIDPAAVEAAGRNAPAATVQLGDARELLVPDASVGACTVKLPAGPQRQPSGDWQDWAGAVLSELSRVTRTGGAVVVLAPDLPRPAIPGALRLRKTVPIGLPGAASTIWAFRRA
jgi:23S rRNA G2445 N2-methylase RlmL